MPTLQPKLPSKPSMNPLSVSSSLLVSPLSPFLPLRPQPTLPQQYQTKTTAEKSLSFNPCIPSLATSSSSRLNAK
ncbi:hypothetical protein PRUPE_6G173000 [Prunus persica]|uniref:Uncharacterized protein n=1 Tax=Prunus persica TaxID=3760 RepID=A0A251NRS0_PRUPE|nr:hypothetical protein PRUPE_6G173000 [Prunus persica]